MPLCHASVIQVLIHATKFLNTLVNVGWLKRSRDVMPHFSDTTYPNYTIQQKP